jgi:hypothetical protein
MLLTSPQGNEKSAEGVGGGVAGSVGVGTAEGGVLAGGAGDGDGDGDGVGDVLVAGVVGVVLWGTTTSRYGVLWEVGAIVSVSTTSTV